MRSYQSAVWLNCSFDGMGENNVSMGLTQAGFLTPGYWFLASFTVRVALAERASTHSQPKLGE